MNQNHWGKPPRLGGMAAFIIVAIVLLAGLTIWLAALFPEVLQGHENRLRLVRYLVLLLALILSGVFLRQRLSSRSWLKHLAIWTGIAAVLLAAYGLRDEVFIFWRQMAANLVPHKGIQDGGAITFRARQGGHFVVEAKVDGVMIRFLLDTGASDVVISPGDAKRLGFDLNKLSFSRAYQTANGQGFGAPVRLQNIAIGPIFLQDVRAAVNQTPMQNSLLGMSFLSRLPSYEVAGDKLTLNAPPLNPP